MDTKSLGEGSATEMPLDPHELEFAIGECLQRWKDFGVESLESINKQKLKKVMTSKSGTSPAPSAPKTLDEVKRWLGNCQRCQLEKERKHIVFGSGNPTAKLMFVGEGPGAEEDRQGLPFVGRSGQLLTKIIEAMGYDRPKDTFIANVVKCRPPNNRTPLPEETETCFPFLQAQIEIIKPTIIVALGLPAATTLLGRSASMSSMRGRFHPLHWNDKILVMPTYHPAYLLRNPHAKRFVWSDMKLVKSKLEAVH